MADNRPFEVTDFSGGITDNYINADTNKAKTLDNMRVTKDKKIKTREGSIVFNATDAQLPTGEQRVGALIEHPYDDSLFAFSDDDLSFLNGTTWEHFKLKEAIKDATYFSGRYNDHVVDALAHTTSEDTDNIINIDSINTLAGLITLVTAMITAYDLHDADAELAAAWVYHNAQETNDHSLTSSVAPTTLDECIEDLEEFKRKFNPHDADNACHAAAGGEHQEKLLKAKASFPNSTTENFISSTKWKDHLFVTNDSYDRPVKIFKNASSGLWIATVDAIGGDIGPIYSSINPQDTEGRWRVTGTTGVYGICCGVGTHSTCPANQWFVGGGYSNGEATALSSPDGINWTVESDDMFPTMVGARAESIYFDVSTKYWLATSNDTAIVYSLDGKTWTEVDLNGLGVLTLRAVVSDGNGTWLVAGSTGAEEVALSTDRTTWAVHAHGLVSDIYAGHYADGLFVIGGTGGKLATSPDGITWTERDSAIGANTIYCITYNSFLGMWVCAGNNGKLSTSYDTITWTARTTGLGAGDPIRRIATDNSNLFVSGVQELGVGPVQLSSSNGIEWKLDYTVFSVAPDNIIYVPNWEGEFELVTAGLPKLEDTPTVTPGGAGTSTYVYGFYHRYKYICNGTLYDDRGPVTLVSVDNDNTPDASNISITTIPELINTDDTHYDIRHVDIEICRTTENGDAFYYLTTLANGVTSYTDSTADTTIDDNSAAYTEGGILQNDPPPRAKYVHSVNNTAYYGYFLNTTNEIKRSRIRQSVANDLDSCPETLYIEVDDEITGINSVGAIPIVFCKSSAYRLQGYLDEFGNGSLIANRISKEVGCVSNRSIVQIPDGLVFAGQRGFYFTDSFTVEKISSELVDTYAALVRTTLQADRIVGTYDLKNNIVQWAAQTLYAPLAGIPFDCDKIFNLHLDFGLKPHSCFSTDSGVTQDALDSHFTASCLLYTSDATVLRGDNRGYILESYGAAYSDPKVDTGVAVVDWEERPIIWDYVSPATDFGTIMFRKFCTSLVTIFKRVGGVLSVQPVSYNDLATAGDKVKDVMPIRYSGTGVAVAKKRHFPAGNEHLRCMYKQIQYTNAYVVIWTSDDKGQATVAHAAKTVDIDAGAWPFDLIDYYISFEDDSYETEFLIETRSAAQLEVTDAGGDLPVDGSFKWIIRGYPKTEYVHIEGYTVHFEYLGKTQEDAASTESGEL